VVIQTVMEDIGNKYNIGKMRIEAMNGYGFAGFSGTHLENIVFFCHAFRATPIFETHDIKVFGATSTKKHRDVVSH